MVKVKQDMTGWVMSEHGVPDSKLVVIRQVEDYVKLNGKREAQWLCQCTCKDNKQIVTTGTRLKSGKTKSCGCVQRDVRIKNGHNPLCHQKKKKHNNFNLSGEYGIGYTSNTNEKFYFDLEDYNKISEYTWMKDGNGYIMDSNSAIYLHRLILDCPDGLEVDHINHKKYDNRKNNMRICTASQNSMNKGLQSNNTSGHTGVYFHKSSQCWCAYIKIDGKQHRCYANSKDEAIILRKQLENKYFGKFSFYNSMKGFDNNE